MKRGAHGRWRGLQWEFGHMGRERGGATMRSPMCLLMKVAYARKISAVRWRVVVFVYTITGTDICFRVFLLASP